ncbi:MAG TPA: hypothetical protein VGI39_39040 [Polyangiaceae bacterium]|jgi:hypothetical protein
MAIPITGTGLSTSSGSAAATIIPPPSYGTWQWGGVTFPLSTTSGNTLLRDADPSLNFALDYYAWMIGQYVGARMMQVVAALNLSAEIPAAVHEQIPYDPAEHLTKAQMRLPLFALWRMKSDSEQITVVHARDAVTWRCAYILPPLTAAQEEDLGPILRAIEIVLQHATQLGWDPAYTPPGGTKGDQVWSKAYANLDRIDFVGAEYGKIAGWGDELWLPSIVATIRVKERGTSYSNNPPFDGGVSARLDIFDSASGTTVRDVADVNSWVPLPKTP